MVILIKTDSMDSIGKADAVGNVGTSVAQPVRLSWLFTTQKGNRNRT